MRSIVQTTFGYSWAMKALRILVVLLCCTTLAGWASAQFMSDKEKKSELAKIAMLEKSYKAAKTASMKAPKDTRKRTVYVKATDDYAHAVMVAASLGPKEKYPRSLRLYREAQKVNPKDPESKKWIKTIEDIYRSMGLPIPK